MGVAGIAYGKVRSCFLCNENRHLGSYAVFSGNHISSGIGSDCKFAHGKSVMMKQYVFFNILLVFFRGVEIGTVIIRDHAVLEGHTQILVFQFV